MLQGAAMTVPGQCCPPPAKRTRLVYVHGCSNLLAIVSSSSLERRVFPCCDPHGGGSSPFFPQIAACKG